MQRERELFFHILDKNAVLWDTIKEAYIRSKGGIGRQRQQS